MKWSVDPQLAFPVWDVEKRVCTLIACTDGGNGGYMRHTDLGVPDTRHHHMHPCVGHHHILVMPCVGRLGAEHRDVGFYIV